MSQKVDVKYYMCVVSQEEKLGKIIWGEIFQDKKNLKINIGTSKHVVLFITKQQDNWQKETKFLPFSNPL